MRIITTILFTLFSVALLQAQSAPDTINKTDSKGRKQGVWKKTHPQNTVYQYVGQFKDDKPYGTFKYYYIDGALKVVMKFSNGGMLSRAVTFWENGRVMSKGNYINQEKDSTWIYYNQYGYLNLAEQYSSGKLDGWRITYYQISSSESESPILEQATFKEGKMEGEWKKFHRNGKLEATGNFKNNQRDGVFLYYYADEKRRRTESYDNGVKHGYFVTFDESGKVLTQDIYWEGTKVPEKHKAKYAEQFKKK